MGISESNPSGSANWLRQGEPLHERITAAPPNSGSMRFTGSYFIEFTAQQDLGKPCHHDPEERQSPGVKTRDQEKRRRG